MKTVDGLKLFAASVEIEILLAARDQNEADLMADKAIREEISLNGIHESIVVTEANYYPTGWSANCFVNTPDNCKDDHQAGEFFEEKTNAGT